MGASFQFEHQVAFVPGMAEEILRSIPAAPGVFGLFGAGAGDQPYVTRAADVRRRMARILAPPEFTAEGVPVQSKRLNLRGRVARIGWTATGSEWESMLVLYEALAGWFGYEEGRRRMRLHTPFFLRLTTEHAHPRVYSTNRLSHRSLEQMYGPFPSRMAADRYCDAVLDLFRLRRCYEDLEVSPTHPGCAYGEMKKCMAPCNLGCSGDEYKVEAEAVEAFLASHGASLLDVVAKAREEASAAMDFEKAAAAHERWTKIKAAAAMADELVRPLSKLRMLVVQATAPLEGEQAAVFLIQGGLIVGPERLSTLGVRTVKEQTSVGSSLFAQPLMLHAVPLAGTVSASESPEIRAAEVIGRLSRRVGEIDPTTETADGTLVDRSRVGDHLALLRRWYYRPEKQRAGEYFFPNDDGSWPIRRLLRGAARMAMGEPKAMAETDREGAAAAKVRILHEGREGVERAVAVVARKGRRKAVVPGDVAG